MRAQSGGANLTKLERAEFRSLILNICGGCRSPLLKDDGVIPDDSAIGARFPQGGPARILRK
jgi:hypothetical protein